MYSAAYCWAKILQYLEEKMSAVAVSAVFDDAQILELSPERLVLYTPSDFRQESIRRSWKQHIEEAAKALFDLSPELAVWGDYERKKQEGPEKNRPAWDYNPHFRFENFIAGDANLLPLKAAMYVSEHPGSNVYNPLFLYGPPGVGKTHLLQAIANGIAQNAPEAKLVYIKGDQFTNELIQAILSGNTAQFKQKYRHTDVLLVDDIHFLAGKEATQEEFFHTFNDLFERGKQIVLTSDRKPGDIPTLEDRLKGRFGVGVMVGIVPPDEATRRQIVLHKATDLGLKLDEASVNYITAALCDNVRQIEGGLRRLLAYHELAAMALTYENVVKVLADVQTSETPGAPTPDLVVRYVCRYYGLEPHQLKSPLRGRNIAEPRQIAMYLIRQLTKMSFPAIGSYFGRDQATVQHAVKKVQSEAARAGSSLADILSDIRRAMETNL